MSEATPPTPMNPPSAVPPPDPLSAPNAPRSTAAAAPTPAVPGAGSILGPDTKWILITICAVVAMLLLLGTVAAVAVVASHAVGNRMMNRGSGSNDPTAPGAPGQRQQPRGGGMGGWGAGGRGTGGLGTGDWMTRLLPGLEHGDVVLQGPAGTPVTKRVVIGTITASTPTSVTIKAADGYSSAFTISTTTAITDNGRPATAAALTVGASAQAIGTLSGTAATADRVSVNPATTPVPKPQH